MIFKKKARASAVCGSSGEVLAFFDWGTRDESKSAGSVEGLGLAFLEDPEDGGGSILAWLCATLNLKG